MPRIFCFGLPADPPDRAVFAAQVERLCRAMHRAGSETWAGALPPVPRGVELSLGQIFLGALLPVAPRRLVLLGDARGLHKELAAARDALGRRDLEIVTPVLRVELPPRPGGLPHPGAVVR